MEDKIKALETALVEANTVIEGLKAENAVLKAQVAALESAAESLAVTAAKAPASNCGEPFKANGKLYQFTVPTFTIDGKVVKASEAAKDKTVREAILKDYPGVLEEA